MTEEDLKLLGAAVRVLEHPGLAARLGSMVGKPIDLLRQALPAGASQAIAAATTKALDAALAVALRSIRNEPRAGSRLFHKVMATASGAVGGSVGLAALPVELPISTIIMLRSIAEIARSEGEDLAEPETALACIEVFALGARAGGDDAADSGYFAVRGVLAKSVSEAARFIAERGIVSEGAPLLAAFIAQVASRFGVVVTQKLAAQILPVVGALGGAAVNYAFIDHFQAVARAHFTVRRLERSYGKDVVHIEYERFRDGTAAAAQEQQDHATRPPGPTVEVRSGSDQSGQPEFR
jgi:EcsC family protein